MTDDLVKELQNPKGTSGSDFNATYWCDLTNKAADRIEQLEAALDDVATHLSRAEWHYLKDETLITIGEKKDG